MCRISDAFLWTTYEGTACPANIKVFLSACAGDERVQAYKAKCQPFVLQINPNIQHIAIIFFTNVHGNGEFGPQRCHAASARIAQAERHQVTTAVAKRYLEEQVSRMQAENERLQIELKIEQNRHLNMLSKEYNCSQEGMSKQITDMDYTLTQYKQALYERDDIIEQQHQQLQQQRTNAYAPYNTFRRQAILQKDSVNLLVKNQRKSASAGNANGLAVVENNNLGRRR